MTLLVSLISKNNDFFIFIIDNTVVILFKHILAAPFSIQGIFYLYDPIYFCVPNVTEMLEHILWIIKKVSRFFFTCVEHMGCESRQGSMDTKGRKEQHTIRKSYVQVYCSYYSTHLKHTNQLFWDYLALCLYNRTKKVLKSVLINSLSLVWLLVCWSNRTLVLHHSWAFVSLRNAVWRQARRWLAWGEPTPVKLG